MSDDDPGRPAAPPDRCELCRREVPELTRHHLIPRARHRTNRARRTFEREELIGRIAWLCRPCHKQIHVLLTEKQLEQSYHTLERLREHPELARFLAWIRSRPGERHVPVHRPRRRRRR